MENEIYCSKCKYIFRYEINGLFISYDCKHPNNITEIEENNWYHKYTSEIYKNIPENINKNNDCKWYEMKF